MAAVVRDRQGRVWATLLLLLAVVAAGCAPRASGSLRYGLTLNPSGVDPHVNQSSELGIPLTSVYDTLVYQDPETLEFLPGLAERWEVSEDGKTYTFYLKQGVRFHDGTPFDAEAVRFNLERITSPDLKSQKARFMLGPYERVEVVDDRTIRLVLSQPFSPLLDSLSQVYLGMASPTAVRQWGADYQLHQVGTGPFLFSEYVPGDRLVLKRNPGYKWGPAAYAHRNAQVEEIVFRIFTDPPTRSPALETGEVDVMGEIPPLDAVRLKEGGKYRIEAVPIPGVSLLFFLNTSHPPLDDLRVRQALLYGADRPAIVSTVFQGLSPVAYGPLSAVTPGYDPAVQSLYPHEPARAAALLSEAGWKDGDGDGVLDREGRPLALEAVLMAWGYTPEIIQLLTAQWAELGVRVDSRVVTFSEAFQIAGQGEFDLMPFTLSGSDPDLLRKFFHSQGGNNWSKVQDTEMDGWLDRASQVADRAERSALYGRVQRRVMEQALAIPIRDYVNLNGVAPRVDGLRYDAQGWFPWLIDVALRAP